MGRVAISMERIPSVQVLKIHLNNNMLLNDGVKYLTMNIQKFAAMKHYEIFLENNNLTGFGTNYIGMGLRHYPNL